MYALIVGNHAGGNGIIRLGGTPVDDEQVGVGLGRVRVARGGNQTESASGVCRKLFLGWSKAGLEVVNLENQSVTQIMLVQLLRGCPDVAISRTVIGEPLKRLPGHENSAIGGFIQELPAERRLIASNERGLEKPLRDVVEVDLCDLGVSTGRHEVDMLDQVLRDTEAGVGLCHGGHCWRAEARLGEKGALVIRVLSNRYA